MTTDMKTTAGPLSAASQSDAPATARRAASSTPDTARRPASGTTGSATDFCTEMHMRALDRASTEFVTTRNPEACGVAVEVTQRGVLAVTVTRRADGPYQPRWTLHGAPCSRLDAETVAALHLGIAGDGVAA